MNEKKLIGEADKKYWKASGDCSTSRIKAYKFLIKKTRSECEKEKKTLLKHFGIEENAVVVKEEGKTGKELMLELVDREQRIDHIREDVKNVHEGIWKDGFYYIKKITVFDILDKEKK